MSIKKSSKKPNKNSGKIHTQVSADTSKNKAQRGIRKRGAMQNISEHKGAFIFIVATAIMGLTVIITFGIICFSNLKMNEIDTSDDTVQELMSRYFNGTPACYDAGRGLFANDKKNLKDLSTEEKEHLTIGYLAYSGYGSLTYAEIDAVYKEFFGKDQTLEQKLRYDTNEGSYISYRDSADGIMLKDDEYYLEADCSYVPDIATCVNLDKAYKSENGEYMKFDINVLTRDFTENKLFSGLDRSEELVAGEDETVSILTKAKKWEALFKYDNKEEVYRLISTKPIK